MALESEALFLRKAVRAGVLDYDKGTAALYVYSQAKQMGAGFTFGEFLVERGLLTRMALDALTDESLDQVLTVSRVGDFELIELLAEGQNGAVFKANQISLNRPVAVKILDAKLAEDPRHVAQFLAEARTTARLNHPNIVQGIEVGSDQGLHYFAMELVDGGSVRSLLLKKGGPLAEITALKIATAICEGLKAAHAAGIVHRDLKPDNVLITRDGQIKIADLGISQRLGAPSAAASGTQESGEFWASPHYAAPEVIQSRPCDARSDLYSLGAMLFELLTARPPFLGETPELILDQHVNDDPPDVQQLRPGVSVQTASLLRKLLAKDPAQRVPDAASAADAFARILQMLRTAGATGDSGRQPPQPPPPAPHAPAHGPTHGLHRGTPGHGVPRPGSKPRLTPPHNPTRPKTRPNTRFKPRG